MRLLLLTLIALKLGVPATHADEKVSRDPAVPQLKVFDKYIGQWKFRMQSTPGVEMVGEIEAVWIHGGRLVRQSWKMEAAEDRPEMSGENIWTYDTSLKTYRHWSFNSYGTSSESVGTWDEENKSMVWNGKDAMGNHVVTKSNFADDDKEEFTIKVTSQAGEVLADISGTTTRK